MLSLIGVFLTMFVALLVVMLVHPRIVRFAQSHKIVDNPDARKLQRSPVPVMGGVAVFMGLVVGLCAVGLYNVVLPLCLGELSVDLGFEPVDIVNLLPIFLGVSIMLAVGVADDVSGLSPRLRFLVEIGITLMLMLWTGESLNRI